jgi:hypothetical protein
MVAPEHLAIASVLAVAVAALLMSTLQHAPIEAFTAGNNFDIAQAVTRAYKNVLDRTPTEPELVEYHARLQDDDTFDVTALENALRETGEYRRLVRLQTQSANPGLEGALTEAQVLGKLRGYYRQAVGVDPDEATLVFLRERYRRTRLDDVYIQELIKSIAKVSDDSLKRKLAKSNKSGKDGKGGKDGKDKDGKDKDGKSGKDNKNNKDKNKKDAHDPALDGGRNADSMTALCAKLGADANSLKADIECGKLAADSLLGGRCPKDQDAKPDMLSQVLLQRQIDSTANISCRASRAMQAAEIATAGYVIPPEQLGSWAVPQKHPPVCVGGNAGKPHVWGPINSQTALIGTPLDVAKEMEGKLGDLVLL